MYYCSFFKLKSCEAATVNSKVALLMRIKAFLTLSTRKVFCNPILRILWTIIVQPFKTKMDV